MDKIGVLQLIDSLDGGGAERVSLNLANALSLEEGIESFLCATRRGGILEPFIDNKVGFIILNKKSLLDIKAIYRLIKFVKKNNIKIIHAHATSFLMAVIVKFFTNIKVVWHDHNGFRDKGFKKHNLIIKISSIFFNAVFCVNKSLKNWSKENLYVSSSNIVYLENFPEIYVFNKELNLNGNKNNRIVCLANLRWQKDHLTLFEAFKEILKSYPNWHLLLVGQDKNDSYSNLLKTFIETNNLENSIHILGSRSDTADILINSTIGVLSSKSEGLPVALLEYGLAKLPVVCTNVGECEEVLENGKYGKLVPPQNSKLLTNAFLELIENQDKREGFANSFYNHILKNYSKNSVIKKVVNIYKS